MPDWTYHPFYHPVIKALPAESRRKATMLILKFIGITKIGRELFKYLSHGVSNNYIEVFRIKFNSRYGIGPDIDLVGEGLNVLQYLGSGFLSVGPISYNGNSRCKEFDYGLNPSELSLTRSIDGFKPSFREVLRSLDQSKTEIPVSAVIEYENPELIIKNIAHKVDFLSIRDNQNLNLNAIRNSTAKPLLLRINSSLSKKDLIRRIEDSIENGFNGIVLGDSSEYIGKSGTKRFVSTPLIELIDDIKLAKHEFGDNVIIVASGNIITPQDGLECISAGATLVEYNIGLIYSGPELISRTIKLEATNHKQLQARKIKKLPTTKITNSTTFSLFALFTFILSWLIYFNVNMVIFQANGWSLSFYNSTEYPFLVSIVTFIISFLLLLNHTLFRKNQFWSFYINVFLTSLLFLISPFIGVVGVIFLLIQAVGNIENIRLSFRKLFEPEVHMWLWSRANLGRRAMQIGLIMICLQIITYSEIGNLKIVLIGCIFSFIISLNRGLLPGGQILWFFYFICSIMSIVLVYCMHGSLINNPSSLISLTCLGMGLIWLWKPIMNSDYGQIYFPDV